MNENNNEEKILKGYVDVIFNVWRMGKDAQRNYEESQEKLDYVSKILDHHIDLLKQVDEFMSDINSSHGTNYRFVEGFDMETYIEDIEYRKRTLEKTTSSLKKLAKKYDRILRILQKNGFQIWEFDGKKFNDGMSLKVVAFDTMDNVEEDTITETIKPAIYYNDKEYQKGEVIVSKANNTQI